MARLLDQLKTKIKKKLDDLAGKTTIDEQAGRFINTQRANAQAMGSNLKAAYQDWQQKPSNILFRNPQQGLQNIKSSANTIMGGSVAEIGRLATPNIQNKTLRNLTEAATRLPGALTSGVSFGTISPLQNMPAQTIGGKVGDVVGSMIGYGASPVTKGIIKLTNPLANKAVLKIAPKLAPVAGKIAPRLSGGIANVGQGLVFNAANRQVPSLGSVGLDLVTGTIAGPNQFKARPAGKGFDFGRTKKTTWHPEDVDLVDKINTVLKTTKKLTPEQISRLDTWVTNLGRGYLKTETVDALADQAKGDQVKFIRLATAELMKVAQNKSSLGGNFPDELVMGIKGKANPSQIKLTTPKQRGFVTSVEASPRNVSKAVKLKVSGEYEPKPNKQLMGEAKVLLSEIPDGSSIRFDKVMNVDQKVAATIQEAINLDKQGNHAAAANLYNNLARYGTELGRGVQAFSLLDRMSPAAISKTVAARIQQYNKTANKKLPELTGEQQKLISQAVDKIDSLAVGSRERNMAINELHRTINGFIPSSLTDKALTVWKAGLLTSLRTHERNMIGNTLMGASEVAKDAIASPVDWLLSKKTGQRTLTFATKTGKSYQKGFQAAKDMVRYGYDPEETITKFDLKEINWGNNPVEQALKKYTDAVFRTLGAEDKIPWNTAFARSLYDQAGAAALNVGKRGDKVYIQNIVKKPTEAMLTAATKDANYATFKDPNKLSKLAGTMKHWANERWYTKLPAEILAPFTGVPSSIAGKTMDYSPIGLVKGAVDVGQVMLSNTPLPELQRQAAQEVGRGVMGTGLYALGAYLMSQGLMTGQPKDATEARQWQLENKPANSILVGGKWRSINSVGPQTLVLLSGAKLNEAMSDPEMGLGGYAAALGKDQLSQTFLQGVQQPLAALTDPNRYGKSYLGNQASSVIPNIVKDTSKALDTYVRENNTVSDYFKNAIPLLRNQNLPKRDALGNIIRQEPTGASAFVDLFNSKTPISNSVVDELARLNNASANATPGNLTKNQTVGGVKTALTPAQLNELEAAISPKVQQALSQLFSTPEYQNLSDEDKGKAIDDVAASVRKQVRGNLTIDQLTPTGTNRPTVAQASAAETNDEQVMIVNPETGSVKTIPFNWTPPELKLTGQKELDKRLKSKYTGALTSRINDVVTLYENGKITQEQAEAMIAEVNSLKSSTGGKKISLGQPAKLSPIKISAPSYQIPVVDLFPASDTQSLNFAPQRARPTIKLKIKQLPGVKLAR